MRTLFLFCLIFVLAIVSAEFLTTLLACHNKYRKRHGVPLMTLNDNLTKVAQPWADELAKMDKLEHNQNRRGYGENIATGWGNPDQLARDVCKRWYEEKGIYNFTKPGWTSGAGHFTQMIWKSSTQLGAGYARGKDGICYVVADYSPAGNVVNPGQFKNNVLRPKQILN